MAMDFSLKGLTQKNQKYTCLPKCKFSVYDTFAAMLLECSFFIVCSVHTFKLKKSKIQLNFVKS
jgi:hypothetical protein